MKEHTPGRVLVVDDEQGLVNRLCDFLASGGHEPVGFSSPVKSLEALKEHEFDILLADFMMPEMNGIQLLSAGREIDPDLVGIIVTEPEHGTIHTTGETTKGGAFDCLLKPFTLDSTLAVISRAMRLRQLQKENGELRAAMAVHESTKVIHARAVGEGDGKDLCSEGAAVDMGPQKEMERVLIRAAQQWRVTFDSIRDMIWLSDPDGTILRCNRAVQEYLGKPYAEIINRPCFLMMHGAAAPIMDCPLARARVTKTRETRIHQIGSRWYNITLDPILDESGGITGGVHVITDITQNKRAEEELRAMSLQDELTGLLNRRGFLTLAEQQLRLVHRMQKRLILLFIDLDRMKWINDTLGHPEGDLALKNTGLILKKTFRESDLISRVGGDEFVVVTVNAFDESMETILARLEKNLSAFNAENRGPYPLSFSIGAVSSEEGEPCDIEALLTKADQRMYENKKAKNLKAL